MRIAMLILLFLSIGLSGCFNDKKEQPGEEVSIKDATSILKQSEDNLLAGISTAVCYSGFRNGQHPDRGDGANNPSYEETLEDLKIISKDAGFKLIRIYDSRKILNWFFVLLKKTISILKYY